jgi:hypothetical protein
MSDHESIERETVRLLVEALKREHQYHRDVLGVACFDCPVCKLIKRCDQ